VQIDRLTHFTVPQTYTLTCLAKTPDTLFVVSGDKDGNVGIATVGTQFFDQDLKVFFTITQGSQAFEVGDQFVFTVGSGTDLNQANIDEYDELPQKNFGPGLKGFARGDDNLRFNDVAVKAAKFIDDLKYVAQTAGSTGNDITIEYAQTVPAIAASLVLQDLTFTAITPGAAGNNLNVQYLDYTPAQKARVTIQNLEYQAVTAGTSGNSITVAYTTGGTAGSEVVTVVGSAISVQIQSGVSTAGQIAAAIAAFPAAAALVTTAFKPLAGNSSTAQSAPVSATSLTGGSNSIGAAGSEVVSVVGNAITVTLQSGTSTATQVKAALDASSAFTALASVAISGTGSHAQTSFVTAQNFTGGANIKGPAGSEVVEVTGSAIKVFLESGKSTFTQVRTAVLASTPASALVDCQLIGSGSNFVYAPMSAVNLVGGLNKFFAFNHDEFSDATNFTEGNASIQARDATLSGKVEISGHTHLSDVLSLADGSSGQPISNVQRAINSLIGRGKLQLHLNNDGTFRWDGSQLVLAQDLKIMFRDGTVVNTISAGTFSLSDGQSLYAFLYDLSSQTLTTAVGSSVPANFPAFRIATRVGDKLYWFNNVVSYAYDVGRIGEGGNFRQQMMTLLTGGGTVSVPSGGGSVAWSGALFVKPLGSSALITIATGSVTMNDDDVAYIDLDDPITTATKTLTVVPRSTAGLNRPDRLWIFHRGGNRIHVRNGTAISPGEETTIGDAMSDDTLTFIGAASRTDNAPAYTTANGGSTANNYIADGDSLTKAVKKLDTQAKTDADNLTTHATATSGVHGVTGNVVGTTDTQTLTNKTFDDAITMKEIATPSNPASGYGKLYRKADGNLYTINSSGTETQVGTGSGGSGAGGGALVSLSYRAEFAAPLDDAPTTDTSVDTSTGYTDANTYQSTGKLYKLSYDATKTVTTSGTNFTLSGAPGFTIKAGDMIIVSGETPKRITTVTTQTTGVLESAFSTNQTGAACNVSQAVHTVDLNNYAGSGLPISSEITTTIDSVLVDYDDTVTVGDSILDVTASNVAVSASVDNGSSWSAVFRRTNDVNTSATPQGFTTAGTQLKLRFFADKTSGSGTVNLLRYTAYFHTQTVTQNGNMAAQAAGFTDGSGSLNCTFSVVNNKTRITLTNGVTYVQGVNPGSANGQLEVYVNGQKIPRYVSSTVTPDASYSEVAANVIDLDSDYSALNLLVEVVKRVGVVDTANSNTARITALELKPVGINYITASDAESSSAGWNRYQNTASATPVSGTGGTPSASTTFGTTTTNPLRGLSSFLLSKDAANRQGEGLSYDFTIDRTDRAKVLTVSFDYETGGSFVPAGFGVASDLQIYLYDVTNSLVIQPAGYLIDGTGKHKATFQTASNSTSYRLIFHIASTNSSSWTFKFDNIKISPETTMQGVPVSDWTSYVPASTAGLGNATTNLQWRRNGGSVEVRGTLVAGSTVASEARVSLPSVVSDPGLPTISHAGTYARSPSTSNHGGLVLIEPGVSYVTFSDPGTWSGVSAASLSKVLGNSMASAGETISINFSVPIQGWSSNVAMSNDTETRIVSAKAGGSVGSTTSAPLLFPTVEFDTHGMYSPSTGKFTVPVPGYYELSSYINAAVTIVYDAVINGATAKPFMCSAPTTGRTSGSIILKLNAGDTVYVQSEGASGAIGSESWIALKRLSGPSAIAATEAVNAKYYVSSSHTVSTSAQANFDGKIYDTHGAVTTGTAGSAGTWKFTAPVAGKYAVKTFWNNSVSNSSSHIFLYKNGVNQESMGYILGTTGAGTGATTIQLNAGDTIDLRSSASFGLLGAAYPGNLGSWIAIEKVGN
jgi:hypothetical protein